jgi:fumarylacetoacetase
VLAGIASQFHAVISVSSGVPALNETHDPDLKSWVVSANRAGTDYPIQNLPLAIFRRAGRGERFRGGIAIGDQILDLAALHALHLISGSAEQVLVACSESSFNNLLELGADAWSLLRHSVFRLLREDTKEANKLRNICVGQAGAQFALPARIGDYTDFYASVHHATAVGKLFRPDNPLLPNYKWVPVAYHGRASSIRVSEQQIQRPMGQILAAGADQPELLATRRLDYELEVGVLIGAGNPLGKPVAIQHAEQHVFGLCLLNDWSARDIQAWEYQPLGPFLAKNFATTISPWIVTMEALAPFRLPWKRAAGDPQPLPYLDCKQLRQAGAVDLQLEAAIETPQMRATGRAPYRLSNSNFRDCYWSISQMVAHHTVNGCNLEAGDLLGSGTQSGPAPQEAGSLLELTDGGKRPITLTSGESRTFLADGDRVIFRGWCEKSGQARIGFGEVAGTVVPAVMSP